MKKTKNNKMPDFIKEFDPTRRIVIDPCNNGYVVTTYTEYEEGGPLSPEKVVVERTMPNGDRFITNQKTADLETCRQLFYTIMEVLGIYNSKHDEYNLIIELKKINLPSKKGK